jgi:serine phosphatase RsbU (regulator of sigma subunit)
VYNAGAVVYFVGKTSKSIERLAGAVAEQGTPCAVAGWNGIPEAKAHLCILVSPPENHTERASLASLTRRRIPLFATADHPVFSLYGKHAVCRLPCELSVDALARFLPWFAARSDSARNGDAELAEKNRKLVHELRLASELQRSILPRGTPSGSPVNLARKYVPYQYIGGDFYDFVTLDAGRLGLVIADACGHGIAAAFLTAMFKSAFGLFAAAGESPSHTFARLNRELARTLMADNFMSAFYAVLDGATGQLTYCSAGHPPQLLFRASGEVVELSSVGFLLGSVEETRYADGELTMEPGDRLLLYTDGLVEATDASGSQFGRERVAGVVRSHFAEPIEDISNRLLSEAVMFLEEPTFQDDVTFIFAELPEEL